MHISRANSVVFAYVSTLYETCSRHVVSLTTANWLRFWLEDAQTILCNTWHDKLPFDQPTCRLLTHSGRKTSFILFFFFFFSEISVQYSTHVTIVINGICKIKISGKNAEITNFHAVLLLSRLYLISYFRFRIRLCVVCARYGTRKLSTRFSSVLFTLTDRVHWFTDDEYLILLKVLILLRSILLFFFLF